MTKTHSCLGPVLGQFNETLLDSGAQELVFFLNVPQVVLSILGVEVSINFIFFP